MKEQAEKFGSEFMQTQVTEADLSKRPFILKCENGEVVSAQAVIISTGASAKYLGLANEKELIGKGVSACATCDGFFYRDQDVYVVGGGDTAMEEASFLTKFAKKVTLVHRRDTFRASKPMQQRVFDNPKIEVMWDSSVEEILFDEKGVHGLKIMNSKTGKTIEVKANGLFMGIGHTPNTQFLNKQLELDDHGFIITKNGHPDTNIPGVFACGDVQDNYYRQAISAAGTGCMAAIRAEKYLEDVGSL